MSALELRDVVLTYPDGGRRLTALDQVSLTVEPGEVAVLVGPSGSGKSSLLAVAATLIRPDSGTVRVGGVDVTDLTDGDRTVLRRDRIGIVFQQPNLIDSLTVLDQLTVMASLSGRSPRAAVPEARRLLDAVGIGDCADRRPGQLSGGQRQRVNIARALMGSPTLLLVDEPTSALDHQKGAEIMTMLRRMTTELRLGTVLVTHDTGQLRPGDYVLHCRDGRLARPTPWTS